MKKLTSEERELQIQWQELEAGGVPLEPPEFRVGVRCRDASEKLVIEDEDGVAVNMIYAISKFRWAYILSPRIRCNLPGKTIILDSELEVPWPDPLFQWLDDPKERVPRASEYIFPGKSPLILDRKLVVNHCLGIAMRRGDLRRGLLLGIGHQCPPERYKTGARISATLRLLDQEDRCHSGMFEMMLDRTGELRRETTGSRESLFSKPHPRYSRKKRLTLQGDHRKRQVFAKVEY